MDNAQLINNIKQECKRQNIALGTMLESCHLSKGFIYDVEKRDRTPAIDKISAIAEYLNVSVDYLLGRTDEQNGNSITTGDINGSHNANMQVGTAPNYDPTANELVTVFNSLNFGDKVKVMSLVAELSEKKGA